MGIEIAALAKTETGIDILPSFVIEYPAIGDLRNALVGDRAAISLPKSSGSEYDSVASTPESTASATTESSNKSALQVEKGNSMAPYPAKDSSAAPQPSVRITLIQGRRPSSGDRLFYLIADGTGSVATYIHLPPFKSKLPVYGIDSPYLRCPSRLTPEGGIFRAAELIVEALIKFQPHGSFSLGGFSGGAMIAYEVSRQLATAGRGVDNLMVIDMCCPRPAGLEDDTEVGWRVYDSIASRGGSWNVSDITERHLRAVFGSVAAYHPPPMTESERPKRTAIIWAKKGMIDRCSSDHELMQLLAKAGIPTEPFPGFMEDSRMGAIAWGLPNKTDSDLGPNGWERYVGEALCLSVEADHLEMPMPSHVHLLYRAMEEALAYLRN